MTAYGPLSASLARRLCWRIGRIAGVTVAIELGRDQAYVANWAVRG